MRYIHRYFDFEFFLKHEERIIGGNINNCYLIAISEGAMDDRLPFMLAKNNMNLIRSNLKISFRNNIIRE